MRPGTILETRSETRKVVKGSDLGRWRADGAEGGRGGPLPLSAEALLDDGGIRAHHIINSIGGYLFRKTHVHEYV